MYCKGSSQFHWTKGVKLVMLPNRVHLVVIFYCPPYLQQSSSSLINRSTWMLNTWQDSRRLHHHSVAEWTPAVLEFSVRLWSCRLCTGQLCDMVLFLDMYCTLIKNATLLWVVNAPCFHHPVINVVYAENSRTVVKTTMGSVYTLCCIRTWKSYFCFRFVFNWLKLVYLCVCVNATKWTSEKGYVSGRIQLICKGFTNE